MTNRAQQIVECVSASIVLLFITNQHASHCRDLIIFTSIGYAVLYLLLGAPPESKSRILSTINAIILTLGSLLCFTEWPYNPVEEGWTGTQENPSYPATFAALFLGYLQFDLIWIIAHRKVYKDFSAAIHHTLFIFMTHYVLSGVYFKKAFAWLSFTELSTPFLNIRLHYASSGQKDSAGYTYSSLLFAFTFLLTRVVGYGLGLLDVWMSYDLWNSVHGLIGVSLGLVLGYLLNLFWALKIIKAVLRVIKKNGKDKST